MGSTSLSTQRAERILARCREIAAFSEVAGETTRTFLSPPMHKVHALISGWMEAAKMAVSVDAIGNLRGIYHSPEAARRGRLYIGSHLDTVVNAGAFDGVLGVVMGIAIVEELRGVRLPFAIEVIGFSEEEGVRFGKPFLGSLAFADELDAASLRIADKAGVSLKQAIREFGLDPAGLHEAKAGEDALGYIEVHIEQGPVLESEGIALGIVPGVAGQSRLELIFTGQANHAGTTPMHLRHDAIAAAAAWIGAVEAYAQAEAGLVATVGKIEAKPGAGNVIASEVTASLDVRHANDLGRKRAVEELVRAALTYSDARGVNVKTRVLMDQSAVQMDARFTALLSRAARNAGIKAKKIVSGAGHDAMIVARRMPATMLFVRTPGGLSHHPEENVYAEDVEAALAACLEFLGLLAKENVADVKRLDRREAYA